MAKKAKNAVERIVEITNKKYEIMLVWQPELLEAALDKKLKEFEDFLAENGGKVDQKENWGKKQLAYRIKRFDKGIYVNYLVELPSNTLSELDNYLRIHTDVIRHLVLSAPKADYTLSRHDDSPLAKKTFSTKQKHALGERRCSFCTNQMDNVDFKDVLTLKHFVNGFQKIKNKYHTGKCLRHQKRLAKSIKRARHVALLPFVN